MSIQKMESHQQNDSDYQTDFVKIAQVFFKRKWLLIIGTLILTSLGIALSLILPKIYTIRAFYQLSNMQLGYDAETSQVNLRLVMVPDYKKYSSLFTDPEKFIRFIEERKFFDEKELRKIKNEIRLPLDLSRWMNPVYAYEKADIEELAQIPSSTKNFTLGVDLSYENEYQEIARTFVQALGEFISDCIIYCVIYDYISTNYNIAATQTKESENFLIITNFNLEQLFKKRKEMQSILSKYPESSNIQTRQVVSVDSGGNRFLAPITQLVGVESSIADTKEKLAIYSRNKEIAEIYFGFFSKMKEHVQNAKSGENIFIKLESLKKEMFKDLDLNIDTVKEVFNQLTIDIENFKTLFYEEMRFISDPVLSQTSSKVSKKVIVISCFFIGLFIFGFLVFILEFWEKNKESIIKS